MHTLLSTTPTIYFLSPDVATLEKVYKGSGPIYSVDNDYTKRITLSPSWKISISYSIMYREDVNINSWKEYSTEYIDFYVVSPWDSLKHCIDQVKGLMNTKLPKDSIHYRYYWTINKSESIGSGLYGDPTINDDRYFEYRITLKQAINLISNRGSEKIPVSERVAFWENLMSDDKQFQQALNSSLLNASEIHGLTNLEEFFETYKEHSLNNFIEWFISQAQ